jgi:hypothetical protein
MLYNLPSNIGGYMFTQNFNLPLLYQNQSMKEISLNEGLNKIDHIVNKAVIDIVEQTPETPSEGDLYILKNNQLTLFLNGKWEIFEPKNNMIFFVISKKNFICYLNEWVFV